MTTYDKPFLTIPEQLDLLRQRGMIVSDEARAAGYLQRIGYYRLSAYWHSFRQSELVAAEGLAVETRILDRFKQDTHFQTVVDLYVFDKKLRLLMMDALERIEVAVRTNIALTLGSIDRFAHHAPALLREEFIRPRTGRQSAHDEWLEAYRKNMGKSREDFIAHFREKYPASELPVWVAVELWDFGLMSRFFAMMQVKHQLAISRQYGIESPALFKSWLRTLNATRNLCAHHARLWNRPLIEQPKAPPGKEIPLLAHLAGDTYAQGRFYHAAAIACILLRRINPSSSWPRRFSTLMESFPQSSHISLQSGAGFPEGWREMELWG